MRVCACARTHLSDRTSCYALRSAVIIVAQKLVLQRTLGWWFCLRGEFALTTIGNPFGRTFVWSHSDTPISRLSAVARLVIWWVSQNSFPYAYHGVLRWRLQCAIHRADLRRRLSGEWRLRRRRGSARAAGAAAKWRPGFARRRQFDGHQREPVRRPNNHRGPRPRWWSHRRGLKLRRGGHPRVGESPQIPPGGAAVCCVAHSVFTGYYKVPQSISTSST